MSKYSMIVSWSEDDQSYIVSVPHLFNDIAVWAKISLDLHAITILTVKCVTGTMISGTDN